MVARRLCIALPLTCVLLAIVGFLLRDRLWPDPPAWRALQQWAATAEPGTLLKGNAELEASGGKVWQSLHTQESAIPFLFSDGPEYLYPTAVGKGLASMRLSTAARYLDDATLRAPFGVGLYHINLTRDDDGRGLPHPLRIVARALPSASDQTRSHQNTQVATVRLLKGAYGKTNGMPVQGGKLCALHWFGTPNAVPTTVTLKPGEARTLFETTLVDPHGISAMFDCEATNAFFVQIYVTFGEVQDFENIAYAPCGTTIGTNCGSGAYWKRILRPAPGTRPFNVADTHARNKIRYPFVKTPRPPELQFLVDETWDLRPETPGKAFVRTKGGQRKPFKGDYNVEYRIVIPVVNRSNQLREFALIDTQRFGMFGGAAQLPDGRMVSIPKEPTGLVHRGLEGVLLDRVRVPAHGTMAYAFRWFLTGGSYGDQEWVLVPLPPTPDARLR